MDDFGGAVLAWLSLLVLLLICAAGVGGCIESNHIEKCGIEGTPYKVGNHAWRITLDKASQPTGEAK